MSDRCKELVPNNFSVTFRRCARKAVKDGYCKQHHPDSVKARQDKANARFEEQRANSIYTKYGNALKRIAELEQQVRWIPCSERLPVNDSPVLVHGGCAYYRHDAGWFTLMGDDAHRPITWNVTHWKPLPPPPSENDNG